MVYDSKDLEGIVHHRMGEIQRFSANKCLEKQGEIVGTLISIFQKASQSFRQDVNLKEAALKLGCILSSAYTNEETKHLVRVNGRLTVSEMVDMGRYDGGHIDYCKEHFVVKEKDEYEINLRLKYFSGVFKTNDIIREINRRKLRFASLAEFLSFGYQYPDIQRICGKILTFGSDNEFIEEIPMLNGGANHDDYYCQERLVRLWSGKIGFRGGNCFLVTSQD